jgi:hypothetical protein
MPIEAILRMRFIVISPDTSDRQSYVRTKLSHSSPIVALERHGSNNEDFGLCFLEL